MMRKNIFISTGITIFLVLIYKLIIEVSNTASLLPPLLFWSSLPMGLFALSASVDLSEGKWFSKLSGKISEYLPTLLLPPFIFLIFSLNIKIYAWSDHPGTWLSPAFFIIRNFIFLLLPFITGFFYLKSKKENSDKIRFFSILYILSFVISQSFLAFDLVMTLEYPWINTLFGGFFFVESLLIAVTFLASLSAILNKKYSGAFINVLKDSTKMIMGFSLFWAGLFFSQYLVIWYGNLPEEVVFIAKRVEIPFLKLLGEYALATLFVIPFITYISKKAKINGLIIHIVSFFVLTGYLIEKIFFVLPTAKIDPASLIYYTVILGIPFLLTTKKILSTPVSD